MTEKQIENEKIIFMDQFEIRPKPQQRHRISKNGGMYDPSNKYRKDLKMLFKSRYKGPASIDPIHMTLIFNFKKPKKPKHREHIVKPDLDNMIKAITDSGNGIFYKDDSQICYLSCLKRYSDRDGISIILSRSVDDVMEKLK